MASLECGGIINSRSDRSMVFSQRSSSLALVVAVLLKGMSNLFAFRTELNTSIRVLLGSFSNYLVTKSSAPVMVARKKLSGRKTKIVSPNLRLANNLTPSRRLAEAKID